MGTFQLENIKKNEVDDAEKNIHIFWCMGKSCILLKQTKDVFIVLNEKEEEDIVAEKKLVIRIIIINSWNFKHNKNNNNIIEVCRGFKSIITHYFQLDTNLEQLYMEW